MEYRVEKEWPIATGHIKYFEIHTLVVLHESQCQVKNKPLQSRIGYICNEVKNCYYIFDWRSAITCTWNVVRRATNTITLHQHQ